MHYDDFIEPKDWEKLIMEQPKSIMFLNLFNIRLKTSISVF